MKLSKLFVLVMSTAMLVACGGNTKESKDAANSADAVTSAEAPVSTEAGVSVEATSSSSSTTTTTSSSSSSTGTQTEGTRVNYVDSAMTAGKQKANCATEVLNYTQPLLPAGYLTAVENETVDVDGTAKGSTQIANIKKSDGTTYSVLQIGSGSALGILTFTFSVNLKSVVLEVENYTQYNDTTNVMGGDTKSKLYVNSDTNEIDLTVASKGTVNSKTENVEINAKTLKLYNKDEDQRIFVKAITFKF